MSDGSTANTCVGANPIMSGLGCEHCERAIRVATATLQNRIAELEANLELRRIELENSNSRIARLHEQMSSAIGCEDCGPVIGIAVRAKDERIAEFESALNRNSELHLKLTEYAAGYVAERDAARAAARELWQALKNTMSLVWSGQLKSHSTAEALLAKHAALLKEPNNAE